MEVGPEFNRLCRKLAKYDPDTVPRVSPLPAGSSMELRPNPWFVGRKDKLKEIAAKLDAGKPTAIGQAKAVTGLGGIGKTQLAVEYVHRYGFRYPGGVFWLDMEDKKSIGDKIASCGGSRAMNLPGFDQLNLAEQIDRVRAIWCENLPRLLVFDNVEAPKTASDWIPAHGGSRVLITSRCENWPGTLGVEKLPLQILSPKQSLELLLMNRPDARENRNERAAASKICRHLGYLPLALHLAASYLTIYKHAFSFAEYEKDLRSHPILLDPSLVKFVRDHSPTNHIQDVGATFDMSYHKLEQDEEIDKLAAKLFHFVGHFAPTSISREVLRDTVGVDLERFEERILFADAVSRLTSLGLIQEETDGRVIMHRLLREFAFSRPPKGLSVAECIDAFELNIGRFAFDVNNTGRPEKLAREVDHLRHAVSVAQRRKSENASCLLSQLARHRHMVGEYAEARRLNERALKIDRRNLGFDHLHTAFHLKNIGLVLRHLGDFEQAKQCCEEALGIAQEHLSVDDPELANYLNSYGLAQWKLGNLQEAKDSFERAKTIIEKACGFEHSNMAQQLNSIGLVLLDMEEEEDAKQFFEEALAIDEKVSGADHQNVARSLVNLGSALRHLGDLSSARSVLERALRIHESALTFNGLNYAYGLRHLAKVFRDMGNIVAAKEYCVRALTMFKRFFGRAHPETTDLERLLSGYLRAE